MAGPTPKGVAKPRAAKTRKQTIATMTTQASFGNLRTDGPAMSYRMECGRLSAGMSNQPAT
jgi:hypothetical protein